nr:MAG TPA: RimK-related lysine biosynthesis protein, Probable-dependent amine/thiol ligase family Amino-group [Caudoviricetes sp.]
MRKQTTCYICDKPIEPEWLPEGEFIVCDECSSDTDKLSVEKLQSDNETLKKALTEIRENIEEHNQIYDLSTDTALLLEGIDGLAFEALAALEGREDE